MDWQQLTGAIDRDQGGGEQRRRTRDAVADDHHIGDLWPRRRRRGGHATGMKTGFERDGVRMAQTAARIGQDHAGSQASVRKDLGHCADSRAMNQHRGMLEARVIGIDQQDEESIESIALTEVGASVDQVEVRWLRRQQLGQGSLDCGERQRMGRRAKVGYVERPVDVMVSVR